MSKMISVRTLTDEEKKIIEFIKSYTEENNIAPSYMDITENLGYANWGLTSRRCRTLAKKGVLKMSKTRPTLCFFVNAKYRIYMSADDCNKKIENEILSTVTPERTKHDMTMREYLQAKEKNNLNKE